MPIAPTLIVKYYIIIVNYCQKQSAICLSITKVLRLASIHASVIFDNDINHKTVIMTRIDYKMICEFYFNDKS